MKDYSTMSDSEINYLVARYILKAENVKLTCRRQGDVIVLRELGDGAPHNFDPCNSWADAGLIIQKYGI